jgi:uncharacterized radical SAM superfamily Fe-S cluster-containing enzyme
MADPQKADILEKQTESLCPQCARIIPAFLFEEHGKVFMSKNCPAHGAFKVLMEKDARVYKKLMNKDCSSRVEPFENIMLDVTYSCNLDCNVCYLPNRNGDDLRLDVIKGVISGFEGKNVWLSGGEPTLRKELPEILRFIRQKDKSAVLLTNGLRLADGDYVRELKSSGLKHVLFSFNGFDDAAYEKINGRRLLSIKLKALKNLVKEKMNIILSLMIVKGVNEKELRKTYRYYLRNFRFFAGLKLRTAVLSGRCDMDLEQLYLSDMIVMLSRIIGVTREELVDHFLSFSGGCHQPCRLTVRLLPLLFGGLKNSNIKKIRNILVFFYYIGLRNIFYILMKKLKGEKLPYRFNISIRVWPDRHRIDLDEIKRCRSCYFQDEASQETSFCYGLITNKKNTQ